MISNNKHVVIILALVIPLLVGAQTENGDNNSGPLIKFYAGTGALVKLYPKSYSRYYFMNPRVGLQWRILNIGSEIRFNKVAFNALIGIPLVDAHFQYDPESNGPRSLVKDVDPIILSASVRYYDMFGSSKKTEEDKRISNYLGLRHVIHFDEMYQADKGIYLAPINLTGLEAGLRINVLKHLFAEVSFGYGVIYHHKQLNTELQPDVSASIFYSFHSLGRSHRINNHPQTDN